MKPNFLAVIILHQLLSTADIVAGSNCMCDSNDLLNEIYFIPGVNTPLTEDCFTNMADPNLQMVHDMAESRLAYSQCTT